MTNFHLAHYSTAHLNRMSASSRWWIGRADTVTIESTRKPRPSGQWIKPSCTWNLSATGSTLRIRYYYHPIISIQASNRATWLHWAGLLPSNPPAWAAGRGLYYQLRIGA